MGCNNSNASKIIRINTYKRLSFFENCEKTEYKFKNSKYKISIYTIPSFQLRNSDHMNYHPILLNKNNLYAETPVIKIKGINYNQQSSNAPSQSDSSKSEFYPKRQPSIGAAITAQEYSTPDLQRQKNTKLSFGKSRIEKLMVREERKRKEKGKKAGEGKRGSLCNEERKLKENNGRGECSVNSKTERRGRIKVSEFLRKKFKEKAYTTESISLPPHRHPQIQEE
jgi:hypothetical protein